MDIEEQKTTEDHLLEDEIKYAIIFHKKQGLLSDKKIAEKIKIDYDRSLGHSTVQRIWDKYGTFATINNRWNEEGRPTILNDEQRDLIEEAVREDRRATSEELRSRLYLDVSRQTLNRELINMGYYSYKAQKRPLLNDYQKAARLEYARSHRLWNVNDWRRVIFTDECIFRLLMNDGRVRIRRRADEDLGDEMYQPTAAFSDSILVWGAISEDGVGPLILVEGTVTGEVYLDLFRYRLKKIYPGLYDGTQIYQDDNAPGHNAGIVRKWFEGYGIERLDWPAKSPDLNIIENVWGYMKFQMKGMVFDDTEQLWKEVCAVWNKIPLDYIQSLYASVPNRVNAVIEAQGGVTEY